MIIDKNKKFKIPKTEQLDFNESIWKKYFYKFLSIYEKKKGKKPIKNPTTMNNSYEVKEKAKYFYNLLSNHEKLKTGIGIIILFLVNIKSDWWVTKKNIKLYIKW